jgi:outer membrane biosynthesis protein TonB
MVGSIVKMVTVLLLLLGALALMTGCAVDETPAPGVTPVTDSDAETEEETAGLTEGPTPEAPTSEASAGETPTAVAEVSPEEEEPEETAEPTVEPSPTPIVVVDVDSACVDCHTDQDRLAELAEEPEQVHLSSGEG